MADLAPVDGEVMRLLMSGEKIAAIKLVRERRHIGLKEAKDYVDAIEAGIDPALRPPTSTITSSDMLTWLFYAALVAALVYAAVLWKG